MGFSRLQERLVHGLRRVLRISSLGTKGNNKTKRLRFKMGEVFPADDELACWMLQLAMIANDLIITTKYVKKKTISGQQGMYFVRLICSHFREAMNALFGEESFSVNSEKVQTFISSLPTEVQEHYSKLKAASLPWESKPFVKSVVVPIRNSFFHYPTLKQLVPLLTEFADCRVEENPNECRLIFADAVSMKLAFGKSVTTKEAGEVLQSISPLIASMITFAEMALGYYFRQKPYTISI